MCHHCSWHKALASSSPTSAYPSIQSPSIQRDIPCIVYLCYCLPLLKQTLDTGFHCPLPLLQQMHSPHLPPLLPPYAAPPSASYRWHLFPAFSFTSYLIRLLSIHTNIYICTYINLRLDIYTCTFICTYNHTVHIYRYYKRYTARLSHIGPT